MELITSKEIIGQFFARLEESPSAALLDALSMFIPSSVRKEKYAWLGMSPAMRHWIGGRQAQTLRENGIEIENLPFEATLEFFLEDLRRDKTGQVMARVNEMADRTVGHWAKLLSNLIIAGETALCYDGQAFFDVDHAEGDSGTQSNDISVDISTPTAPTSAEMETAVLKAVEKIMSFKDDQGEPMNENAKQFRVMVPVSFMGAAAAALKNPVITDATGARTNTLTNIGGFGFELDVNPRLSWTTKLAVFRADGSVKPFIRQEETPVEMSALAEGSEIEFNERKHRYGVYASRNAGYGYWQHACLVTLT
jgi:phage major head subunit gpT-like protein